MYNNENDETMQENVETLAEAVVGHRIVKVERDVERVVLNWRGQPLRKRVALALTLDNGTVVSVQESSDCCAYTDLDGLIEHMPTVDHIITAVETSEDYTRWHILADLDEVLELQVGWSEGNGYYGYGFHIAVTPAEAVVA